MLFVWFYSKHCKYRRKCSPFRCFNCIGRSQQPDNIKVKQIHGAGSRVVFTPFRTLASLIRALGFDSQLCSSCSFALHAPWKATGDTSSNLVAATQARERLGLSSQLLFTSWPSASFLGTWRLSSKWEIYLFMSVFLYLSNT